MLFKRKYEFSCSKEAAEVLRELLVEVRGLFKQVEALDRLLLVVPASSCEAERSFSALRWFKTWLRATMSPERRNSVVVCHVHRDKVDELDRPNLEFIAGSETCKHTFWVICLVMIVCECSDQTHILSGQYSHDCIMNGYEFMMLLSLLVDDVDEICDNWGWK